MATNEFEEPPVPTRREQLASIFGKTQTAITGSDRIPLRVAVLFVVAGFLASWAPGWAYTGPIIVACLLLLAFQWPGMRR